MASRSAAGASHRYALVDNQDTNTSTLSANTNVPSSSGDYNSSQTYDLNSLSIVRRRRLEPIESPVKAMSLVGLKNLFFRQAKSPDWRQTNRSRAMAASSAPGLERDGKHESSLPTRETASRGSSCSNGADLESQNSTSEKANRKKGFTIDARVIGDATLGLSDGLTVPFALTAGLSALGNTKVVVYGGFAELIAGAISMGLGGYLSAKGEADAYQVQRDETEQMIATNPQAVWDGIAEVFVPYNLPRATVDDVIGHLRDSPHVTDFVMQFQHCVLEPASSRAATSALTIAIGYFLGGLLPLIPYLCVGTNEVYKGLYISIGVMVIALFVFGYVKTCVVAGAWKEGRNIRAACWGGIQMVVVGGCCAGAAMGLVKAFSHGEGGA